jgi:hypothetical protein
LFNYSSKISKPVLKPGIPVLEFLNTEKPVLKMGTGIESPTVYRQAVAAGVPYKNCKFGKCHRLGKQLKTVLYFIYKFFVRFNLAKPLKPGADWLLWQCGNCREVIFREFVAF